MRPRRMVPVGPELVTDHALPVDVLGGSGLSEAA